MSHDIHAGLEKCTHRDDASPEDRLQPLAPCRPSTLARSEVEPEDALQQQSQRSCIYDLIDEGTHRDSVCEPTAQNRGQSMAPPSIEVPKAAYLAKIALITPSSSLKKGILRRGPRQTPSTRTRADITHTSAMMKAIAQMAQQIPIHVSHPVHV